MIFIHILCIGFCSWYLYWWTWCEVFPKAKICIGNGPLVGGTCGGHPTKPQKKQFFNLTVVGKLSCFRELHFFSQTVWNLAFNSRCVPSRNLGDFYRLQGFGTQNSTGTLATVSTMGKHNGEAQRGAQREPIVANKKKKDQTKRDLKIEMIFGHVFFPIFFVEKMLQNRDFNL